MNRRKFLKAVAAVPAAAALPAIPVPTLAYGGAAAGNMTATEVQRRVEQHLLEWDERVCNPPLIAFPGAITWLDNTSGDYRVRQLTMEEFFK